MILKHFEKDSSYLYHTKPQNIWDFRNDFPCTQHSYFNMMHQAPAYKYITTFRIKFETLKKEMLKNSK